MSMCFCTGVCRELGYCPAAGPHSTGLPVPVTSPAPYAPQRPWAPTPPVHDPDDCAKAGGGCANPTSPMGLGPAIEEWIRLIVRQEIEAAFPRCPNCVSRVAAHAPECPQR